MDSGYTVVARQTQRLTQIPFFCTDSPVVSSSIALAMMGIIQIAIIIEEPFSVLPLKKITDGIDKSAQEHLEYNAWEHDNRPQSITSRIYQDYLSEDYASQEYLEAMSKDTVIRHRELNNWSPPASTIRPAQFEREPPAAYAEQQQYTTKPMLEVEQPPPEESYATSYTEYAEPYLSPQQQQQIQQPQEIAPPPQQYSPPYNPPQQYSPPYNPPQQYSPPYDPPQQYSPPYNPPPQEQVSYQSTPTSTEFDAQQSQNINVEEEEEGYSNLSPMERLERMKLNVLREINDSLRDCNDNDRNSKR